MKKILIFSLIFISLHASNVQNYEMIEENVLIDSSLINASVEQGTFTVIDSTVDAFVLGQVGDKNEIRNSSITNSTLMQGTVDLNQSIVLRSSFYSNNELLNSSIENNSVVEQGTLDMQSGTLNDSSLLLVNLIDGASIRNSTVSQSEIDIYNSTVENLTLESRHTIDDGFSAVSITDSVVTQGRFSVVGNSSLDSSVVTLQSRISGTVINNSIVNLCGLSISNGVTVSGNTIQQTCNLNNTTVNGVNLSIGMTTITK